MMVPLYLWNGQRSAAENHNCFRPLRAAPGVAPGRLILGLSAYVSNPRGSLFLAERDRMSKYSTPGGGRALLGLLERMRARAQQLTGRPVQIPMIAAPPHRFILEKID